jgi:PAS domain-containing protein
MVDKASWTHTVEGAKEEGGMMGSDNTGNSGSRGRVRTEARPHRWIMRAGSAATVAACLYVIAWSALLGNLADNLTVAQQVATATVAILSGGLIWVAVRALILQQRFLAQQESMKALEVSRAFVRVLMDNLPAAIWLKSCDHRYLAGNLMWAEFNPAVHHWKGKTLEDLIGHTDRELYDDARVAEFERTDDIVIASGLRSEYEYDEIQSDRHLTFRVVKIPVFDAWGSVVSVAGIGFDMTGQRKVEDELEVATSKGPPAVVVLGREVDVRGEQASTKS